MYQSWRSSCYLVNTEEFRQIYQHLYHFMDTVLTNNQLCSFQIKSHSRRKKMKTLISVPSFAIIIVTVICVLTFIYNYFILPTLEKITITDAVYSLTMAETLLIFSVVSFYYSFVEFESFTKTLFYVASPFIFLICLFLLNVFLETYILETNISVSDVYFFRFLHLLNCLLIEKHPHLMHE